MAELELSAGVVEYEDTGGEGPVVVLLHGVAMDGSLWRHVVADLRDGHRCVVPTLPLGGHRRPMRPDADLSVLGVARLVAEFLDALGLTDVTLVMNDWGGAQALVADGRDQRIGRLVITSCEAFDNFPPGLPGKNLYASARMPGGLRAAFTLLKVKPMRRLPMTWGRMSRRPVPDAVMDAWFRPLWTSKEIRRDLRSTSWACRRRPSCCAGRRPCVPSTGPRSSPGPRRTGSCRRNTAAGWPRCCPGASWSRSRTATP